MTLRQFSLVIALAFTLSAHSQVSELPTTVIGPEIEEYAPNAQSPQTTMFGYAVATGGKLAFVGEPAQGDGKGRVAIFALDANEAWQRVDTLLPPAGETSFGKSLAYAHGSVVAAAASGAYIYRHTPDAWLLVKKIDAPPGVAFGALARDVHTIAIAVAPLGQPSAVHVFEGDDDESPAIVAADDAAAEDAFGYEVALAGRTLVVGAPFQQNARGAVYIFRRQQNGWMQTQKLVPTDSVANLYFGASVAIDHDRIVVGAPGVANVNTPAGHPLANQGAAYVYAKQQGDTYVWQQTLQPTNEPGEYLNFGTQVRIRDDRIAVTSPIGFTRFESATCLIYELQSGQWTPQWLVSGEYSTGISLSLSKHTVILGGPLDSGGGFDIGHGLIAQLPPVLQ